METSLERSKGLSEILQGQPRFIVHGQRSNSDPGVASPTMQPWLHAPPKNPLWQGRGQSSRPAIAMSSTFNARWHPCLTAGCCETRRGANTSSAAGPAACVGLSMLLAERSKDTAIDRHPKWQTGLQDRRELSTRKRERVKG